MASFYLAGHIIQSKILIALEFSQIHSQCSPIWHYDALYWSCYVLVTAYYYCTIHSPSVVVADVASTGWTILVASISLPQVAEGSNSIHLRNIVLHLSSQLLGWSVKMISSCDDGIPNASPSFLHFSAAAKLGTILMFVSRGLGLSSPVVRQRCGWFWISIKTTYAFSH